MAEVVERDEHVRDHQRQVRRADHVGVALGDGRLGVADEVVAEQPDGAAGERREAFEGGHPVALQLGLDHRVRIVERLLLAADRQHAGVDPDHRPRAEAEE